MKYKETLFVDYIEKMKRKHLHNMDKIEPYFPASFLDTKHIIMYGPPGIGKYSVVLQNIQKYSPSGLKYERKLNIKTDKKFFSMKISDIHYEIDIELLGCNAKIVWNNIFNNILDIISTKNDLSGIIVCKNFHKIHSELLECFFSYMQSIYYKNLNVFFVIITENVCFIPTNILNISKIISLKRPVKSKYKKIFNKNIKINEMKNIKDIYHGGKSIDFYTVKCQKVIHLIDNYKEEAFYISLREALYDLLICNLDINECIWVILCHYIKNKKIKNMKDILGKLGDFLKLYNNNYRPIYHLEKFFLYLCSDIHGL